MEYALSIKCTESNHQDTSIHYLSLEILTIFFGILRLLQTDGQTLESKIMYYSRFDLLCIDEFPNVSEMDPFLVHQIFNTFSERGHSILLCMQCQPEKMEELFSITSIGQSITQIPHQL